MMSPSAATSWMSQCMSVKALRQVGEQGGRPGMGWLASRLTASGLNSASGVPRSAAAGPGADPRRRHRRREAAVPARRVRGYHRRGGRRRAGSRSRRSTRDSAEAGLVRAICNTELAGGEQRNHQPLTSGSRAIIQGWGSLSAAGAPPVLRPPRRRRPAATTDRSMPRLQDDRTPPRRPGPRTRRHLARPPDHVGHRPARRQIMSYPTRAPRRGWPAAAASLQRLYRRRSDRRAAPAITRPPAARTSVKPTKPPARPA